MTHWLPLLGVAVVVIGFALRFNPVPVVIVAGLASGLAAGKTPGEILALLGNSFVSQRALLLFVLTLPAIGVLERAGLREHARNWIASLRGLTLSRLLLAYLGMRQMLSMLGLTNVAGHAQTVRPLLAPMAEAAAEKRGAALDGSERDKVRAFCAAHRQCRPVLRRRRVHRARRGAVDPGFLLAARHRAATVADRAVGAADRDRGLPDPRPAHRAVRAQRRPRADRHAARGARLMRDRQSTRQFDIGMFDIWTSRPIG